MTPEKIQQLASDIDEWAQRSFPVHLPRMGVLEEVGELTHCFLKRFQRIRGFESKEHFLKEALDAVGDISIYCLHDMALSTKQAGCVLMESAPFDIECIETVQEKLSILAEDAAWLLQDQDFSPASRELHEEILSLCRDFCISLGWDYETLVQRTYDHVTTRKGATNADMEAANEIASGIRGGVVSR
jgi:hypothetical protein